MPQARVHHVHVARTTTHVDGKLGGCVAVPTCARRRLRVPQAHVALLVVSAREQPRRAHVDVDVLQRDEARDERRTAYGGKHGIGMPLLLVGARIGNER